MALEGAQGVQQEERFVWRPLPASRPAPNSGDPLHPVHDSQCMTIFPVTGRPLKPSEFSGGNATVARVLSQLGFSVTTPDSSRA
ncbi:hypothetical protein GCM10010412_021930 [Nonomuraea recticatena]|uniref:ScoMcrA-like N-terminal head domain-containing protein n=1 Tax=Nonomuraea recticatena TaxID=46178 RepID=A0ABN3RIQ3_9ACTN